MATKKISEFTTLGSLSDTDILPVVNAGSNKKITGATLKTYAQSGLTIPTDVSDLTDTTSLLGGSGAPGQGVPTGGTIGQVLAKIDSTDYSTEWITPASGSGPTNEITNTDGVDTWSVSVGTDGVVTMTTARGGIEFGAMPEVGGPSHLHIMRPAGQNSSTDLYFGDDYNYVKMPGLYGSNPTTQQGVEIGSSLNEGTVSVWKFGTDGVLTDAGGSWTKTTMNQLATTVLTKVVWTATSDYTSGAKLTIQVECNETGGTGNWETQICEAVIAVRGWDNTSVPVISVYGVTHTSVAPLMTFTVDRNPTTGLIEIVGTRTGTASPTGGASLRIYSVETATRD